MNFFYNTVFETLCEVHQLPTGDYAYPIFKNGQSAIKQNSQHVLLNKQIAKLDNVIVYLREAEQRYRVGVATYLDQNKHLDTNTLLQLINTKQLHNSHFIAQYHWLYRLRTHAPNIRLSIKDYTQIPITDRWNPSSQYTIPDNLVIDQKQCDLDNRIYNKYINQTITFEDIDTCIAQG